MILFSDIIGRKRAKSSIINDITYGKISHAYLIVGEVGVGKKIFAKAIANAILCSNFTNGKPCMQCTHCSSVLANGTTELYQLNTEATSIKVDDIREVVKNIILKPTQSEKKVYIIYDGEKMTNQAQNSLLKTLEEPPNYGHIIITTNNIEGVLPTIQSRATKIYLGMNSKEEILNLLISKYGENDINEIACEYAQGSIGKAIDIIESKLFKEIRELANNYVNNLINKNTIACIDCISKINATNIEEFLSITIKLFKDIVVFLETQSDIFLINKDKKYIINNGVNKYNIGTILNVIFILEDNSMKLQGNASRKITLDGMTVKILEELING